MGYTKNDPAWSEGEAPGISAARLNHLETQYDEVENLFNAHTILIAVSDNSPIALSVPASRIVGRKGTGNIVALTGAELMAILTGQAGAAFSFNGKRVTSIGAQTTVGDALRKGTRVTVTELPALTDEKIWKGTGGNVEEVDLPTQKGYYQKLITTTTHNDGADHVIETHEPASGKQFLIIGWKILGDDAQCTAKLKITWDDDSTTTRTSTNHAWDDKSLFMDAADIIGEGLHKRAKKVEFIENANITALPLRWYFVALEVSI